MPNCNVIQRTKEKVQNIFLHKTCIHTIQNNIKGRKKGTILASKLNCNNITQSNTHLRQQSERGKLK